jgi:hypothetical protein
MNLALLVVLLVLLVGTLPAWPYSARWGYVPCGGVGIALLIVLLLGILQ